MNDQSVLHYLAELSADEVSEMVTEVAVLRKRRRKIPKKMERSLRARAKKLVGGTTVEVPFTVSGHLEVTVDYPGLWRFEEEGELAGEVFEAYSTGVSISKLSIPTVKGGHQVLVSEFEYRLSEMEDVEQLKPVHAEMESRAYDVNEFLEELEELAEERGHDKTELQKRFIGD